MLASYIKRKPKWLNKVPIIGAYTANAWFTYILIPDEIYRDLDSPKPHPKSLALLAHEEEHRKRQLEQGVWPFGIKYALFPKYRFHEELLANKASMRIYKKNGVDFDIKRKAQILSGYLYFWPVSYQYAFDNLKKAWDEV